MATAKGNLDGTIRRYEAMTSEEIDAELREKGIDAKPTIDAVQKLVNEKLKTRRRRPRPV